MSESLAAPLEHRQGTRRRTKCDKMPLRLSGRERDELAPANPDRIADHEIWWHGRDPIQAASDARLPTPAAHPIA